MVHGIFGCGLRNRIQFAEIAKAVALRAVHESKDVRSVAKGLTPDVFDYIECVYDSRRRKLEALKRKY